MPQLRLQQPDASTVAGRRGRVLIGALGVVALISFIFGLVSGGGGDDGQIVSTAEADGVPELPGGGTTVLPDRRVVALYGSPGDAALGALGVGTPDEAGKKLVKQAKPYDTEAQPVLPAMELISTVAAQDPGERGDYNLRLPKKTIDDYLKAARKIDAMLILDIQPGYADFIDEVKRLEEYLAEPDVGLALDPEWHVQPPDVPGGVIGSVDAEQVNDVSAYLEQLVAENSLPQKLLVVHQFTRGMIKNRESLESRPDVAIVLNSDGFSDPVNKEAKYQELRAQGDTSDFFPGFKLFYVEDVPLMTAEQVFDLVPKPDFIVYE